MQAIRSSAYVHVDETGWKINGTKHWLWAFANKKLAFYKIDRSRGSKVPIGLLGNPFPGILISDFYSAYNKMNCRQQKCLVHLLREMRDCRGKDPPPRERRAAQSPRTRGAAARTLARALVVPRWRPAAVPPGRPAGPVCRRMGSAPRRCPNRRARSASPRGPWVGEAMGRRDVPASSNDPSDPSRPGWLPETPP